MSTGHLITLKYLDLCVLCNTEVGPGTEAWWKPANRTVTCLPCHIAKPRDPFVIVDPELVGHAGGSALSQFHRQSSEDPGDPDSGKTWLTGSEGEREVAALLHGEEMATGRGVVLDDRCIPGSPANIDH